MLWQSILRKQKARHKLLFGIIAVAVASIWLSPAHARQTEQASVPPGHAADWQKAAGGKMSFDVASVKRNKSGFPNGDGPNANMSLDDNDAFKPNGGLFSATNIPLAAYIGFAYKAQSGHGGPPPKFPSGMAMEAFDIQARGPANATKDQMRLMMQSLLADRFKLAAHWETRQVPAFNLVVAKPGKLGPQLKPHADQIPCQSYEPGMSGAEQMASVAGGLPALCGKLLGTVGPSGAQEAARNITMAQLADTISGVSLVGFYPDGFNRPVIDKTGLTGGYDIKLNFTLDVPEGQQLGPSDVQSAFLGALRDELGLKLEPSTTLVDVFVIDHIEEPSAN